MSIPHHHCRGQHFRWTLQPFAIRSGLLFAADKPVYRYPSDRRTCTAVRSCGHGNSRETVRSEMDVDRAQRCPEGRSGKSLALVPGSIQHARVYHTSGFDGSSEDQPNRSLPSVGCGSKDSILKIDNVL